MERHLKTEATAAFSRQWRPLADAFSESVRHVQRCQLIQFGTCARADCEVTVGHIEHFSACRARTYGRRRGKAPSGECGPCELLLNVLIQHSLDCASSRGPTCFVPNCSELQATVHSLGDPGPLAKLLLHRLTWPEVRTVVWCLGGGDPFQLDLSTGQDRVLWWDHGTLSRL